MEEKQGGYEINLLELLQALLKKWWIILLAVAICASGMYVFAIETTVPTYSSSTMFYVNNSSISVSNIVSQLSLSAAQSVTTTFRTVLTTRMTIDKIIEEGQLPYSYETVKDMITSTAIDDTEIFQVTVTCPDPDVACHIATTIANVFPTIVSDTMGAKSGISVVDMPVKGELNSPGYVQKGIIGAVIGFVLSAGIIILIYMFNDTIESEDFLAAVYQDIPVLSTIPDYSNSSSKKGHYYYGKYYYRPHSSSSTSSGKSTSNEGKSDAKKESKA